MEKMSAHNFMNEYNKDLEQKRFGAIESFLELVKNDSNQEKNDYRLNELVKIISNFDLSLESKQKIIDRFNLDFNKDEIKDLTPSDIAIALLDNQKQEIQDISFEPPQKEENEDLVEQEVGEKIEEDEIDFPVINFTGVILPSSDKKPDFSGETEADLEKENQARFKLVKKIIKDLNIDKGVYVITGKKDKDMMRGDDYKAVVIPENDKLVLVCDAYGNATYISHQTFTDNSLLLNLNKEELKNLSFVSSIIWTSDAEKWQEKISEELFEVNENKLSDIEVIEELEKNRKNIEEQKDNKKYTVEELKDEIKKQFPTAEDWVNSCSFDKIKNFEILGKKLYFIAKIFDLKIGNNLTKEKWLRLGEKIYGKQMFKQQLALVETLEKWIIDFENSLKGQN